MRVTIDRRFKSHSANAEGVINARCREVDGLALQADGADFLAIHESIADGVIAYGVSQPCARFSSENGG
jgi:hypothetical protein